MAAFNLFVNTGRLPAPGSGTPKRGVLADRYIEFARQLASGMLDQMTVTEDDTPVLASGTFTLSSGSGTITATINGVAIAITWATDDTTSAALLAAAINASANALVAGIVTATSAAGVVTVTAARGGKAGNTVTIAASGTGNTASGARLTGGTNGTSVTTIF